VSVALAPGGEGPRAVEARGVGDDDVVHVHGAVQVIVAVEAGGLDDPLAVDLHFGAVGVVEAEEVEAVGVCVDPAVPAEGEGGAVAERGRVVGHATYVGGGEDGGGG